MSDDCALTATLHVTEAHQLGGLALVVHWDMEGDHRQLLVDGM